MVAISKILAVAAVSTAVLASPVAQPNPISPVTLYERDTNPFVDISTLLAQVGDFLGNAIDDVLHLDLNNLGDSVNTLVSNLLDFLNEILPGITSFNQPTTGTVNAVQNQYVSSALGNIVTGLGDLVSKLLKTLTSANAVGDLSQNLRELVSTLDKLVTGLAENLIGYSTLTKNLEGIISALNSALDIGTISTKV